MRPDAGRTRRLTPLGWVGAGDEVLDRYLSGQATPRRIALCQAASPKGGALRVDRRADGDAWTTWRGLHLRWFGPRRMQVGGSCTVLLGSCGERDRVPARKIWVPLLPAFLASLVESKAGTQVHHRRLWCMWV